MLLWGTTEEQERGTPVGEDMVVSSHQLTIRSGSQSDLLQAHKAHAAKLPPS